MSATYSVFSGQWVKIELIAVKDGGLVGHGSWNFEVKEEYVYWV